MRAATLVTLTWLLAGCSGAGQGGDDGTTVTLGDGSTVELVELDSQEGTGSISGVVVDEAIRPLAGVEVTMTDTGSKGLTDAGGLFTFVDVEPGSHFLSVADTVLGDVRYHGVQTVAEVMPSETAKVRIILVADAVGAAYHGPTMKFDGYIEFASGFVDEVLDLAVWNHTYGPVSFPPSPLCACHFYYQAEAAVETHVLELNYEESNPMPHGWVLDLNGQNRSGALFFCDYEHPTPCIAHIDGQPYGEDERSFDVGVWSDPLWVHFEQSFQFFVTVFYVEPAPEGWSFIRGDI